MDFFEIEEHEDVLVLENLYNNLVLHNDEVNTFEHVIDSLIEICKHTWEQAEQCSLFIHYKGKYSVKEGTIAELKPLKEAFLERGISATID